MDIYFILYLVLMLFAISKAGFWKITGDDATSPRLFCILFFFKALAVPVFYLVYKKIYGGVEGFDAGKFYNDAREISNYSHADFSGYLKLLFGLQDESATSSIYKECLVNTFNWDNGSAPDYFYNDNRIVIRLHSLIHFIAFNSYFVHALFNCFLSFIGITFLYKSLKDLFKEKEIILLLILCFFPTLWFYTGAVLKEGIAVFILGCTAWQFKKIPGGNFRLINLFCLLVLLFMALLLKPYLLLPSAFCFFMLFSFQIRKKSFVFLSCLLFVFVFANVVSLLIKHKSLIRVAAEHQRLFADAAQGGLFLLDEVKFVRLPYNYKLVKKIPGHDSVFTIKKDIPFIYWEHTHQQDTLYCKANTDTITTYKLVYDVPESGSNIRTSIQPGNIFYSLGSGFYYSLFFPFFINANGALQWLASLENLAILFSLIICIIGLSQNKKEKFPVVVLLCLALGVCLLIGSTTPNSGAIFRYRSPVVIFILIAAVYYLPPLKIKISSPFQKKGD